MEYNHEYMKDAADIKGLESGSTRKNLEWADFDHELGS